MSGKRGLDAELHAKVVDVMLGLCAYVIAESSEV